MIPTDERRAALHQAKTLAQLGTRDRDDLLRCLTERHFATGEVLFREGDAGDSMAIVVQGALSVRILRPDGDVVEVGRAGVGELFGELACLDPAPRSATMVSLEPTTVYEMSRDALEALRRASPGAAAIIVGAAIREATRRLLLLEERIDRELAAARPSLAPPSRMPPSLSSPEAAKPAAPADEKATRKSGFWSFLEKLRGSP